MRWDYPAIEGVDADLLLVTHEHLDHNGVEAIGGDPVVAALDGRAATSRRSARSSASRPSTTTVAGTAARANMMFVFDFGGLRVAHLGDLGQAALRPEQVAALGEVDLLFVPVGGGPTIGAEQARRRRGGAGAGVVVPMHYRTERIDFLEPVDAFAERCGARRAAGRVAGVRPRRAARGRRPARRRARAP